MRRMEGYWIRIVLCAGMLLLAMLLAACARREAKPLEQPLVLTSFRFEHHGMISAEFYTLELEKAENGTHVVLSINAGAHKVDVIVEEDLLAELSKTATEYRMDLWDGFDKADRRARDGEHFRLTMQLPRSGSALACRIRAGRSTASQMY